MKRCLVLVGCLIVAGTCPSICFGDGVKGVVSGYLPGTAQFYSQSNVRPTFWVGYSDRAKGFRVSTSHAAIAPATTLSQQYVANVKGTWVGGVIPIASKGNFAVRVDGAYLISSTTSLDQEQYTTSSVLGQRWSKAVVDSYFLDAQGAYRLSEAWGLVAGFRWDVVSLKLSNPELQNYQWIPGWESDISVKSYEPYVGLEVVQGLRTTGKLRMQVVGFPALFGNVRFGDSFPNTPLPRSLSFNSSHSLRNAL